MAPFIYLDYNASTPIAPEVAEAMQPFISGHFGNPSSRHWAADPAREAISDARNRVADLLGCSTTEIVFTSGGSESNNAAIKGVFPGGATTGHLVISSVEHPAVLQPCRFLERHGIALTIVPVDRTGAVDPDEVRRAIRTDTRLVSIMHSNNEVGTIQPIREISRIARERNVLMHTDAAQSVGKVAVSIDELGVDLLSIAGHKLYAPKGIGALYVRQGIELEPLIHGAGHESGRRAGTENTPYIVGLGTACRIAKDWIGRCESIRQLRDRFWQQLRGAFGERVVLNGHPEHRLPNTLNVSVVGVLGSEILAKMDNVAASTGSACHSGEVRLSPVLEAMGVPPQVGKGAVRFSLGRTTTAAEIDMVVAQLQSAIE